MTLKNKIVSADEAIAIVRDSDTMCVSGFVGIGTPDELILALERRFMKERHPVRPHADVCGRAGRRQGARPQSAGAQGPDQARRGRALEPGAEARRARAEQRDRGLQSAARLHFASLPRNRRAPPRGISKVGLRTFVDPREQGGKLNSVTTEDLVELLEIGGEEWLRYKAFPINVAFIRGTTCDPNGNLTMEREALTLDNLAAAMAAKNSRGFVIAQVERIAAADSLNPREVQVPGILVDCVVLAEANNHVQTYGTPYNHAFSGRQRVPLDRIDADGTRRAQDHRTALRVRTAAWRRRQSRHRDAGRRRGSRG